MIRIPITMCHGICNNGKKPLTVERFDCLMGIAAEMGFASINYDDLEAWRAERSGLPERPIMLDFDHPVASMRYEIKEVLDRYGFRANLFVQTKPLNELHAGPIPPRAERGTVTWDELGELLDAGWNIGAHTVSHPNLSQLDAEDPDGERLRAELDGSNATLESHLGVAPKDFAFTGTSWSSRAEQEVMKRYRFGRLWIRGAEYQADGNPIRYAELVGVEGPDEADGGPPAAARYLTRDAHPYRLPSMELQALIYEPDAFRRYLEGAVADEDTP